MAPALPLNTSATGHEARLAARHLIYNDPLTEQTTQDAPTSGIAPGHLQANLIVLPASHAADFELFCARDPVPCPLLARSARPGDFQHLVSCVPNIPDDAIAQDIDLRTDAPRFNVYVDGELVEREIPDVKDFWKEDDHVALLIGCSYSFEAALAGADLTPPHVLNGRNVAMYRTNTPLCPGGRFWGGTYVVSMRERVRVITRPYVATHGEPIAWGWDGARAIGVEDVGTVQWGDVPVTAEGTELRGEMEEYVPVFWGCGVTPQEAVMKTKIPGVVIGHAPGYMVVLDAREEDVLAKK